MSGAVYLTVGLLTFMAVVPLEMHATNKTWPRLAKNGFDVLDYIVFTLGALMAGLAWIVVLPFVALVFAVYRAHQMIQARTSK